MAKKYTHNILLPSTVLTATLKQDSRVVKQDGNNTRVKTANLNGQNSEPGGRQQRRLAPASPPSPAAQPSAPT